MASVLLHLLLLVGCVRKTEGAVSNDNTTFILNIVALEPKSLSQIKAIWTVYPAPTSLPFSSLTNSTSTTITQVSTMPETFTILWGKEAGLPIDKETVKGTNYLIENLEECGTYWVHITAQDTAPDLDRETTFLTAPTDLIIGSEDNSGSRKITWEWESITYPNTEATYTVSFPDDSDSHDTVEITTNEKELEILNSSAKGTVCVVARWDSICESLPTCHEYPSHTSGGSNVGLIVGCSLAGVAVIVLLGLAGYNYNKKIQCKKKKDIMVMTRDNTNQVTVEPVGGHTNQLTMEDELRDQFRRLFDPSVSTSDPSLHITIATKHPDKNRFSDILPYDHTLVRVSSVDYINASYVLGRKFIATQDPLPNQEEDFWQMLWDCNVRVAIQLSVNTPSQAVARIINDSGSNNWVVGHDELQVTMIKKDNNGIFCRRTHKVVKGMIERPLEHFHLTSWDEKSSANRDHVLKLVVTAMEVWHTMGPNSPALVYCGAGAGRTGTFIAVWDMIEKKLPATLENMATTVREMRKSRKYMVQTENQYVFIYNCVEDYNKNPSQWSQPELYELAG